MCVGVWVGVVSVPVACTQTHTQFHTLCTHARTQVDPTTNPKPVTPWAATPRLAVYSSVSTVISLTKRFNVALN